MSTTVEITTRPLRPYQVTARDDVLRTLKANDRALYVSACGTGKTITLQAIAAATAGNGLVGAFFPSLFLVGQTLREWLVQYENQWDTPIVVCSDPTVTSRKRLEDENELSPAEIAAMGALVTTNPDELAELLRLRDQVAPDRTQVVFATYQSSDKVAAAQAILAAEGIDAVFDIAVFDEAHRITPGSALGEHVLDENKIRAHKRVSATATPRQFHVSGEGERADDGDLLDESVYGPLAHEYGLRQAIDDGVLEDYRIHATVIPQEDLALAETVDEAELRLHLGIAALRRAETQYGAGRAIAYLSSVKRARCFVAMAAAAGLNAHVITGDVPMDQREGILHAAFIANESGVVANVKCLTEGVDIPALDAVVFVDPRKDKVDIVQAVGRAVRRSPGKTFGRVIIPVLAGEGDAESWMTQPGWDMLTNVLAQMADNDTWLRSELVEHAKGGRDAPMSPQSETENGGTLLLRIDIAERGDISKARTTSETADKPATVPFTSLLNRISRRASLSAVRVFDVDWDWRSRFEETVTFFRSNARMPSGYAAGTEEKMLGGWLSEQRRRMGENRLALHRNTLLDEHLKGWAVTRISDEAWADSLAAIVSFIRRNGRMPSAKSSEPDEVRLAVWLNWMRTKKRRHKLTAQKIVALDEQLPDWDRAVTAEEAWDSKFNAVVEFLRIYARLPITSSDGNPEEQPLSQWLSRQRKYRKGGALDPQRKARLDELLPNWDVTKDSEKAWFGKFNATSQFLQEHGRLPSSLRESYAEKTLALWIVVQRRAEKRGTLDASRRVLLDDHLPDWQETRDSDGTWTKRLDTFVAFVESNGRLPSKHVADPGERALGTWLASQRKAHTDNCLAPNRTAMWSERVPGWLATRRPSPR